MKKTLLALGLASIATTASADSFVYAGGNFGQSDFGSGTDKESAYGFHVGTGILPVLGLEGGYWSHGNNSNSLFLAAKPSIDFGPLHVYAKGGFHSWDREGDTNRISLMYGVGAEYFIVDNLSLGGSWQSFQRNETYSDISSFTVSATFHFL